MDKRNTRNARKMYTISYHCDNCGCTTSKRYNKGTRAETNVACDNCGCSAHKSVGIPTPPALPKTPEKDEWDDWIDPWHPWKKPYRKPYDWPDDMDRRPRVWMGTGKTKVGMSSNFNPCCEVKLEPDLSEGYDLQ